MKTASIKARAVFTSWHAALGMQSFDSAGLLKRISGGALRDPKIKTLADAIAALFARSSVNAKKIGKWLAKHRGIECDGLRLHGEHDTDSKTWKRWSIQPVPTKAELWAEHEAFQEALAQQDAAIYEKAKRGRNTLTAQVDGIVAVDKHHARRQARLATIAAEAEQSAERKAWRAEQRLEQRSAINRPPTEPSAVSFTIVAPEPGSFVAHKSAERLLKHFTRLTASAKVVRWLDGYAIQLDPQMIEGPGRTLDDLHATAEKLLLCVKHERGTAPQSDAASFWPASAKPYQGTLAERDPFALIEQSQKGRPVIPVGALKFPI